MADAPAAPVTLGECRCGNTVFMRSDWPLETYKGNLFCDTCRMAIYDDLPLGVSHKLPAFGHADGK